MGLIGPGSGCHVAHKAVGPDVVFGIFLTDLSFVSPMVVEWWDSMGAII